jgi:hypothetical protein
VEKYGGDGQTTYEKVIGHMRIACLIPKSTDTFSEYVKLIAFPLQHWLRERTPMLRYTHIACLVSYIV